MSQFADNLRDVFAPFGAVSVRRMFGGHGVFYEGLMIALVADDVLYLKVDEASVGAFVERGARECRAVSTGRGRLAGDARPPSGRALTYRVVVGYEIERAAGASRWTAAPHLRHTCAAPTAQREIGGTG